MGPLWATFDCPRLGYETCTDGALPALFLNGRCGEGYSKNRSVQVARCLRPPTIEDGWTSVSNVSEGGATVGPCLKSRKPGTMSTGTLTLLKQIRLLYYKNPKQTDTSTGGIMSTDMSIQANKGSLYEAQTLFV